MLSWVVGLAGLIAAWPAAAWGDPPPASYTLTVNIGGYGGSGTIVSSPAGLDCDFPTTGGPCEGTFPAGAVVTLTATGTDGAPFGGWWTIWSSPPTPSYPGCTGGPRCTVTMTAPVTVDATFIAPAPPQIPIPPWSLAVAIAGGGSGSITGPGITCPNVCSSTYPWNQRVSLIATPGPGFSFVGWSGACSGAATCQVVAPGILPGPEEQVTAQFAPEPKCGLVADRGGLLESSASRRSRKRRVSPPSGVMKLDLSVTCDQSVRVVVAGTLTERLKQDSRSRRLRRTRNVRLQPTITSVEAGTPHRVLVALPKVASLALGHGATDSAYVTLAASNATGTSTATATFSNLTARR